MTSEKRSPSDIGLSDDGHQSKLARYDACTDGLEGSVDSDSQSYGGASGFAEHPHHFCNLMTSDFQELQSEEPLDNEAEKTAKNTNCSKYRGVEWDKQIHRWRARITIRGKKISLGSFTVEEDAARAYNEALSIKGGPMQHFNQGLGDLDMSHIPYTRIGPPCLHETARQQVVKLLQSATLAEMHAPQHQPEVLDDDRHGDFKTSPYRGVSWDRRERKWRARITINKKHKGIGRFNSPEEAARAYDKALLLVYGSHGQRNFPWIQEPEVLAFPYPPSDFLSQLESSGRSKSSCFHGVSRADQDGRWRARITINGKLKHLGVFESEEEAARQYDAAVRALASTPHAVKYQLNFPEEEITPLPHFLESMGLGDGLFGGADDEHIGETLQDPNAIRSQYRGLYWDKKDKKWRVRIHINGRQQHVGRFTDEFQAAQAYDKAAVYLLGPNIQTNFGVASAVVDPAELPAHIVAAKAKLEAEGVLPTKAMHAAELAHQRKIAGGMCSENMSYERVSLSGGCVPGPHAARQGPGSGEVSLPNGMGHRSDHRHGLAYANDYRASHSLEVGLDDDMQQCGGYSMNLPLQPLTADVTAGARPSSSRGYGPADYAVAEQRQSGMVDHSRAADISPFSTADAVNNLLPAIPKGNSSALLNPQSSEYQRRGAAHPLYANGSRSEHHGSLHEGVDLGVMKHSYHSLNSHMSGMQQQMSRGPHDKPRDCLPSSSTELSSLPPMSLRVSSLNTITTGDCVVRCNGVDVKKYPSAATMDEIKKYANLSLTDLRRYNQSEQNPFNSGGSGQYGSMQQSYGQHPTFQELLPSQHHLDEPAEHLDQDAEHCFSFGSYGNSNRHGQLELVDLPPQELDRRTVSYAPSNLYNRAPSPLSPLLHHQQQHQGYDDHTKQNGYRMLLNGENHDGHMPSVFGNSHFLLELSQPADVEIDHKMHMIMTTSTDVTDIPLAYSAYQSLLPAHVA